ncbi:MAG: hypothetical protein P8P49_11665 [Opitutales bacterium]|nr:hypothetical protein [Opitutales bacterium]
MAVLTFCKGSTKDIPARLISDGLINTPTIQEFRNRFEFDKLSLSLSGRLYCPIDLRFADLNFPKDGFAYLPFVNGVRNISRIKIIRDPVTEEIQPHHPLFTKKEKSGKRFVSMWQPKEVFPIKSQESPRTISTLPGINFSFEQPANRFNQSVFSWENSNCLKEIKGKEYLIPNALLDAIVKSNFELFFQQTKIVDEELHAIYLKVLHTIPQHNVARATSLSISNISTYLIIGGLICLFISRFTKDSHPD